MEYSEIVYLTKQVLVKHLPVVLHVGALRRNWDQATGACYTQCIQRVLDPYCICLVSVLNVSTVVPFPLRTGIELLVIDRYLRGFELHFHMQLDTCTRVLS